MLRTHLRGFSNSLRSPPNLVALDVDDEAGKPRRSPAQVPALVESDWCLVADPDRLSAGGNAMSESNGRSDALTAAAHRRIELKIAVSQVESAAAAASASPNWRDDLLRELDDLRIALDQHVDEVEGHDGLLIELTTIAPRLVNKINRVRDEHPGLRRDLVNTIDRVKASEDTDEMRGAVLETLASIARHRQAGADLVYEGYSVDIGGG